MARRRFFVDQIRDGEAVLAGEDALHLSRVLRAQIGQRHWGIVAGDLQIEVPLESVLDAFLKRDSPDFGGLGLCQRSHTGAGQSQQDR